MTETHEIALTIGRIEGKLDMVLGRLDRQDQQDDKRDGRIRKLELADRRAAGLAGIVAAIVAAGAEIGSRLLRPA